jgi:hypothetical protein
VPKTTACEGWRFLFIMGRLPGTDIEALMTHQPTSASRIPTLIATAGKRLGMVLGGVVMAWLLVELLMRVLAAMNILPLSLVEPLRSVRRAPWDAETVAPEACPQRQLLWQCQPPGRELSMADCRGS